MRENGRESGSGNREWGGDIEGEVEKGGGGEGEKGLSADQGTKVGWICWDCSSIWQGFV